eukprot:8306908-Alexandrium_andersonii.AAC.1
MPTRTTTLFIVYTVQPGASCKVQLQALHDACNKDEGGTARAQAPSCSEPASMDNKGHVAGKRAPSTVFGEGRQHHNDGGVARGGQLEVQAAAAQAQRRRPRHA